MEAVAQDQSAPSDAAAPMPDEDIRDESPASQSDENGAVRAQPGYEIAGRDQIVRSRMGSLDLVNDRLAKSLRIGLFNLVRKSAQLQAQEVLVNRYDSLLKGLPGACIFNLIGLKPLRGQALVIVDQRLLDAIIDCQFGGDGELPSLQVHKELSATELRVVQRLMHLVGQEYKAAWSTFYPLDVEYLRTELQPQMLDIAASSEMVVGSSFSVQIGAASGTMRIWIPYATLEPIRDVLYATGTLQPDRNDRRWLKVLTREIQSAHVNLVAELSCAPVTVEQLMAMQPGDFIELDRQPTIRTLVDGVPLFECHYGTHNGRYAIRVERSLHDARPHDWLGDQHGT